MSERDAKIGPTAHVTAYVWHRLGFPYADLFATETGRRLFWALRLSGEWIAAAAPRFPSLSDYLEMRHRAIEGALERIQPDKVIEIGAGLSRRGVTWAADRGVEYVEVDLPSMIAAKRGRLTDAGPILALRLGDRLRLETRDVLAPEFAPWLEAELRGTIRPVVIAEGVIGYFEADERSRLADAIARALRQAPNGAFLCDLRSADNGFALSVAARALRAAIRIGTYGRGVRRDFESREAVERFFAEAGFDDAETESLAPWAHLARLPMPARVWCATVGRDHVA
jgi:O-methyltransferase involved in polyketide biosynthesis